MHVYWIDIVGTCNLRCPSCPTGNFRNDEFRAGVKPLGFMPLDLFKEILAKIAREGKGAPARIDLYNWGEPLLHPKIAEMIDAVNAYGEFRCALSSNLSHRLTNLDAVIAARPYSLRVSLSGFFQDTYSRTHARGNIELVKSNMRAVRAAIDRLGSKTTVSVAYHVYRHNAGEDFERMEALCRELNFEFDPIWASFYPLEKVMNYIEKGELSAADRETVAMLAIKPEELREGALQHRNEPCRLQVRQTAINHDGTVQLCCATYDPANIIAESFLSVSADELMRRKAANATCDACIAGAYHSMMVYQGVAAAEEAGNARLAEAGSPVRFSRNKHRRVEPGLV